MSTTQMQPASSSIQPSTTTHLNSKRVRDIELMGAQDENSDNPLIKKSRLIEGGEAKVSNSSKILFLSIYLKIN